MDIHDLSLFHRMLCSLSPISKRGDRILRYSPRPGLGGQASAVFLLPSAAQGRTAAKKGQLHVLPGRHPSPTRVLQHLRAHGPANGRPYGRYGRAEAVRALTHAAHSVCGPRSQCAGARALDAPVPPRQLYSDHLTPAPPAQERQVSTWAGRCSRRVGKEWKQLERHVPTCTRSTNGCGSLDGANRVWRACRRLRLRSSALQWQRMVLRGQ